MDSLASALASHVHLVDVSASADSLRRSRDQLVRSLLGADDTAVAPMERLIELLSSDPSVARRALVVEVARIQAQAAQHIAERSDSELARLRRFGIETVYGLRGALCVVQLAADVARRHGDPPALALLLARIEAGVERVRELASTLLARCDPRARDGKEEGLAWSTRRPDCAQPSSP